MNWQNPIVEDHKLFLVFKNIGLQILQQLKVTLTGELYSNYFKDTVVTEKNELLFTYLDHNFKTQLEVFFNHSKMPQFAFIATYYLRPEKFKDPLEIVSYAFDLNYNINKIYTLQDFAEYYLIEFHQNLKKSFSDEHTPFPIRMNGK
jgi:hypothetical protein